MNYLSKFSAVLQLPYGWWKKLVLFGLAVFFINVGVDHFINPDFYLSIMPPAFPMHAEAVYVSGFFEILGGICVLIPRLRIIAGWGLWLFWLLYTQQIFTWRLHQKHFQISRLNYSIFVSHYSSFSFIGLTP